MGEGIEGRGGARGCLSDHGHAATLLALFGVLATTGRATHFVLGIRFAGANPPPAQPARRPVPHDDPTITHARALTGFLLAQALLAAPASVAGAQGPDTINVYRYILDVDVPESPALESRILPGLRGTAALGTRRDTDEIILRTHLSWYQANRN